MTPPDRPEPLRSAAELVQDQLAGIDLWHTAGEAAEAAARSGQLSREMRLDLSRRLSARRAEQAALLARAARQLEQSTELLRSAVRPRALLVHRTPWLRERVAARLRAEDVEVIDILEDGAEGAATLVVEQPDLLLVEDRLPTVTGLQLVQRASRFAPRTVTVAQLLDSSESEVFRVAGAAEVFPRTVPPGEIARRMLQALTTRAAGQSAVVPTGRRPGGLSRPARPAGAAGRPAGTARR